MLTLRKAHTTSCKVPSRASFHDSEREWWWCAGLWELFQGKRGDATNPTLADAQAETELIIFDFVDNLLKKTNTDPLEVCTHKPIARIMPSEQAQH